MTTQDSSEFQNYCARHRVVFEEYVPEDDVHRDRTIVIRSFGELESPHQIYHCLRLARPHSPGGLAVEDIPENAKLLSGDSRQFVKTTTFLGLPFRAIGIIALKV